MADFFNLEPHYTDEVPPAEEPVEWVNSEGFYQHSDDLPPFDAEHLLASYMSRQYDTKKSDLLHALVTNTLTVHGWLPNNDAYGHGHFLLHLVRLTLRTFGIRRSWLAFFKHATRVCEGGRSASTTHAVQLLLMGYTYAGTVLGYSADDMERLFDKVSTEAVRLTQARATAYRSMPPTRESPLPSRPQDAPPRAKKPSPRPQQGTRFSAPRAPRTSRPTQRESSLDLDAVSVSLAHATAASVASRRAETDMVDSSDDLWSDLFVKFPLAMGLLVRLVFPKDQRSEFIATLTLVEVMLTNREKSSDLASFALLELKKMSNNKNLPPTTWLAAKESALYPLPFVDVYIALVRGKQTANLFKVARLIDLPDLKDFKAICDGKNVTVVAAGHALGVGGLN